MAIPVALAVGEHLLHESVLDWLAKFEDAQPPGVVLVASIKTGPQPPIYALPGFGAATLTLPMDARVALSLYEKLGDVCRSMGWLPQIEEVPAVLDQAKPTLQVDGVDIAMISVECAEELKELANMRGVGWLKKPPQFQSVVSSRMRAPEPPPEGYTIALEFLGAWK